VKRLKGKIQCVATFSFGIDIPEHIVTLEEAIDYAKEHVNEIPVGELEYVSDSDEIDESSCYFDDGRRE